MTKRAEPALRTNALLSLLPVSGPEYATRSMPNASWYHFAVWVALDGRILGLFAAEPRVGVLEASRRLGVARGTVQARLDRLQRDGVVRGWGPDVDTTAIGYPVTAFATLQIEQGSGHTTVAEAL